MSIRRLLLQFVPRTLLAYATKFPSLVPIGLYLRAVYLGCILPIYLGFHRRNFLENSYLALSVQKVFFINTTNSFPNNFRSSKYVYSDIILTSCRLASFIKPRRAINNVIVGCHTFLRAEDRHFQHHFWTCGVTCLLFLSGLFIIRNRPISWTLR